MNDNVKKYLKVSLTLGAIAGISSLLIGLTNMVTADKITENANLKEQNGLKEVFTESATFTSIGDLSSELTYVTKAWTATDSGKDLGYIYKASGSNAYGSVSILVGINYSFEVENIILLENTETYASTLEDNYVTKINEKKADVDDTSCGATYGAKLIKSMIDEAKTDMQGRVK